LPNDIASSETVTRRVLLDGIAQANDRGSAVWDSNGSLVGVIDSAAGERLHFIPATSIAASFDSLLSYGEIRHALLGVRALDLSSLRFDGDRGAWPATGALIRDDRKGTKLGILRDGPAAKAKLKAGDVIVRVERDILDGTADLGEVLSEYKPGSQVDVRILRGSSDLDVQVTLGSVVTSESLK
jgi:S1-C subfamily serine protease